MFHEPGQKTGQEEDQPLVLGVHGRVHDDLPAYILPERVLWRFGQVARLIPAWQMDQVLALNRLFRAGVQKHQRHGATSGQW